MQKKNLECLNKLQGGKYPGRKVSNWKLTKSPVGNCTTIP